MRWALVLLLLVGCGGGATEGDRHTTAPDERLRSDLGCTERPPGGEPECLARGCSWTPPLSCHGTEPTLEAQEAERRRRELGVMTCTCVCETDRVECMRVP